MKESTKHSVFHQLIKDNRTKQQNMNQMSIIRTDHRQQMHLRKIKRKDEKAYKQIETFKKHQGHRTKFTR